MSERMTPEDVARDRAACDGKHNKGPWTARWRRALDEIEAAWAEREERDALIVANDAQAEAFAAQAKKAVELAETATTRTKKAEAERDEWKRAVVCRPGEAWCPACKEHVAGVEAERDAATAEAAALREALEFYADFDSYFAISIFADPPCGAFINDGGLDEYGTMRPGERARKAIARPGAGAKLLERVTALEAVAEAAHDTWERLTDAHLDAWTDDLNASAARLHLALEALAPPVGHPEPSREGGGPGTSPAPAPAASDVEVEGAAERLQGAPQPPERPA